MNSTEAPPAVSSPTIPDPVWVWGVPYTPLTTPEAVDLVDALIAARRPSFFITANLQYTMLTRQNRDLPAVNRKAAFVVADGMPLVWASRYKGKRLPERITGADLMFHLAERAVARNHRFFFLGGAPGVGQTAAENLQARYPGLQVVGVASPHIDALSPDDEDQLFAQIRDAQADLLFVALGQPKGERWIANNLHRLQVPVSVQVGASLDFAAGRVRRAPQWMQDRGLEWVYRTLQEPGRLAPRYARNILFLSRMLAADLGRALTGRSVEPPNTR